MNFRPLLCQLTCLLAACTSSSIPTPEQLDALEQKLRADNQPLYADLSQPTEYFTYKENEFGVEYRLEKLGFSTSKIFVRVKLKRKEAELNNSEKALLVLDIQNAAGEKKSYQAYKLNDATASDCCEWKERKFSVTMDGKLDAEDKLVIYIWNKEKKEFYIDDFKVEVYNYNYSN